MLPPQQQLPLDNVINMRGEPIVRVNPQIMPPIWQLMQAVNLTDYLYHRGVINTGLWLYLHLRKANYGKQL